MTIKLYRHALSIMSWRVRIALHEKGLAYEIVKVNVVRPVAEATGDTRR